MSSNVVNTMPFIRTAREFPEELHDLCVELEKSYLDIANTVNVRTIGIFPVNRPAITGEAWFLNAQKRQSLRQVYTFTTTADIPLGFKIEKIFEFSRFDGLYFSKVPVNSWYGLIPATNVAIAGQISFYVAVDGTSTTSDLIKFVVDGGAPALTNGKIVIEWLSQV